MTDEFVQMLKDILDKAGVEITTGQLEASLNTMVDDSPKKDPRLDEVIRKIEEERKKNNADATDSKGISMKDWDNYYVVSGPAVVEYNGRTVKKFEGDAVLMLKPDNSIVVHSLHGVNPVSYLARADEIWSRGSNGTFTMEAIAADDRLTITFLKMCGFESMFKELPAGAKKPRVEKPLTEKAAKEKIALTDEEKSLEVRLKRLRIDLAHGNGITFLPAIFDNRVLYAMIKQRPATRDDLKKVKGLGEKRIEKYGDTILQTIREATAGSS
jgi:hypothetical protein